MAHTSFAGENEILILLRWSSHPALSLPKRLRSRRQVQLTRPPLPMRFRYSRFRLALQSAQSRRRNLPFSSLTRKFVPENGCPLLQCVNLAFLAYKPFPRIMFVCRSTISICHG